MATSGALTAGGRWDNKHHGNVTMSTVIASATLHAGLRHDEQGCRWHDKSGN